MRKAITTKRALKATTVRDLTAVELVHAQGGYQQSYGCTKKNSECNACGGTQEM